MRLIQNHICYYAMHTNYDVLGMADLSADYLKLEEREVRFCDRGDQGPL